MSVGLEPTNSLYVTYKAYTNTSFTNAGVWLINAIYKGNGVLSNATSNNLTIIYYSPSTTALSLDSNSVKKGKSIKITPKVLINSNNYETNDGTIDIYVDDVLVAGNININENYTLDTSSLDLGNHKVHAVYHDFKEEYKGVMYTTINGSSSEKYTFEVIEDTSISTLKIYEEDDPNNTTLLVYPDFASGVTLFLYNSLSNSNFTDDELYDLLKYTGIKCDVYVDGVKVDSTYTGYKNGSTLSSYTKYKLQLNSGKHTVQYYHPGYANKNIPESWSNILTVYVGSVPDYATNISVSLSKNEIKRGESIVITPTVLDKENNNVINEGKVFIYLDNAIVANITASELARRPVGAHGNHHPRRGLGAHGARRRCRGPGPLRDRAPPGALRRRPVAGNTANVPHLAWCPPVRRRNRYGEINGRIKEEGKSLIYKTAVYRARAPDARF